MVTPAALSGRQSAVRNRRLADLSTDSDLLAQLATDESRIVRVGVARNANTPGPALVELALDTDHGVTLAALDNRNFPDDARRVFAETSPHPEHVRHAVYGASGPLREELLLILERRSDELLVAARQASVSAQKFADDTNLAKSSDSPDELDELSKSPSSRVRAAAARNPKTGERTLRRLLSDQHHLVRNSVAVNPALPSAVRRRLVLVETEQAIVLNLIANTPKGERDELVDLTAMSARPAIREIGTNRAKKLEKNAPARAVPQKRVCPTPTKLRYTSKGVAAGNAGNASRTYDGTTFRVYRCPCGFYHMTTKVK